MIFARTSVFSYNWLLSDKKMGSTFGIFKNSVGKETARPTAGFKPISVQEAIIFLRLFALISLLLPLFFGQCSLPPQLLFPRLLQFSSLLYLKLTKQSPPENFKGNDIFYHDVPGQKNGEAPRQACVSLLDNRLRC